MTNISRKQLVAAFLSVAVAVVLLAVPATGQERVSLLPAAAGDLVAGELLATRAFPIISPDGLEQSPVSFAWALDAEQPLALGAQPMRVTSREYFVDVTAAELAAGVPVYATAPGALVRINPAPGRDGAPIDPASLVIEKDGLVQRSAIERLASPEQLRAAGAPFAEGTVAFRLADNLGAGTFTVRAATGGNVPYVVHVLDANSRHALELTSPRADLLHGDTLGVTLTLPGAELRRVEGFVATPGGRTFPATFNRLAGDTYRADVTVDARAATGPGLWELHTVADGSVAGSPVLRQARIPFQVTVPTARLLGDVELRRADGGLTVTFGVTTVATGRYEVRGVLLGTDLGTGELRPVAIAHGADLLQGGSATLTLGFGADLLEGTQAPYEIRDLRLVDQGRMGVLHRQARGFVVP